MSLFITFEGGEGAGKTTQVGLLAQALQDRGHDVVRTREPGGTYEGHNIRDLLVEEAGGRWSPMAETLLLFAARTMHVDKIIAPALAAGKVVICDRFTDSTRAYQGHAGGQDLAEIEALNTLVLKGFGPELTFVLDLPVGQGFARAGHGTDTDRFEQRDAAFHEALRAGYRAIAAAEPGRCRLIDARQDQGTIAAQILATTIEKLEESRKG